MTKLDGRCVSRVNVPKTLYTSYELFFKQQSINSNLYCPAQVLYLSETEEGQKNKLPKLQGIGMTRLLILCWSTLTILIRYISRCM